MASYVAISTDPVGFGKADLQALVISDGSTWSVVGDTDLADSIRETLADEFVPSIDGADSLKISLTGLSYYRIDGPHTFDGSTDDVTAPLAAAYGLPV
jgi:hypothetical protein